MHCMVRGTEHCVEQGMKHRAGREKQGGGKIAVFPHPCVPCEQQSW